MKKYIIYINGYKFQFKISFSTNYTIETLRENNYLIHEKLLKYFRNYVLSPGMQAKVLYHKEYIINYAE